jgi:hypothetical protein
VPPESSDRPDEPAVTFSDELERWLAADTPKSVGALSDVFEEKSFAVAIALMMLVSATPLPTGGIMLVFQLIAAFTATQVVIGRRYIWLPTRWRERELGARTTTKTIPFLLRRVRWLEQHSSERGAGLLRRPLFVRFLGLVMFTLCVASALAPPLTGLDTLPALGAVLVALALILEDVILLVLGLVVGTGGIILFIAVGAAVFDFFKNLF